MLCVRTVGTVYNSVNHLYCEEVLEQQPVLYVNNNDNVNMYNYQTHNSESQGQEEASRMQQTSELFTDSTTVKFVNTLNKPPLKLLLSY